MANKKPPHRSAGDQNGMRDYRFQKSIMGGSSGNLQTDNFPRKADGLLRPAGPPALLCGRCVIRRPRTHSLIPSDLVCLAHPKLRCELIVIAQSESGRPKSIL